MRYDLPLGIFHCSHWLYFYWVYQEHPLTRVNVEYQISPHTLKYWWSHVKQNKVLLQMCKGVLSKHCRNKFVLIICHKIKVCVKISPVLIEFCGSAPQVDIFSQSIIFALIGGFSCWWHSISILNIYWGFKKCKKLY